jgi:hypothetical protein
MTRWCKLVALAVGWSGAAGALALAQDAPPAQQTSRWSLFHRDQTPPPDAVPADAAPADDGEIVMPPPLPAPPGTPPIMPQPQTGAPPPPPFGRAAVPPAVAPPGPDRPPNGFSDPIPPDAENGFEPNPEPKCADNRPYYFGLDYLHWWVQKQPVPVLVTTGSPTADVPGALGGASTVPVIDSVSHDGAHDGVRLLFGYDLDPQGIYGVDVSGFWINRTSPTVQVSGNGSATSPVYTRPFFNVITHEQDADPINIPNAMAGTFSASAPFYMAGAEANFRYLVGSSPGTGYRLTLLAGFNFLDVGEKLLINENLTDVPGLGAAGNHYVLGENFTTYNHFYGGQLGAEYEHCIGPITLQFIGKCALGRTEEALDISGSTIATEASGAVATNPKAALYVGPGNVGHYTGNDFAAVPEGQFKVVYQFNQYFRMNLGYDVLWISRVVRPGDQINENVNVQPVGGPPVGPLEPTFEGLHGSGLWAQGFSIGMEVNY